MNALEAKKQQMLSQALSQIEEAAKRGLGLVVVAFGKDQGDVSAIGSALASLGYVVKGESSASYNLYQISW